MNSNEEWGGKKTDLAFWVVKRKSRAWNVDTGLNKVTHGMHLHSAGTQAEPRKCYQLHFSLCVCVCVCVDNNR